MNECQRKITETLQGDRNYTAAMILAAGNSTRMGGKVSKQFLPIGGIPVLGKTLIAYQNCARIREIIVVSRPEDFETVRGIAKDYGIKKLTAIVAGGATRQESAQKGLQKLSPAVQFVAVADGARCLITPEEIEKVCLRAYEYKAASAAHRVTDTVKRTNATGDVTESVDRNNLWLVQTPQVFVRELYEYAAAQAVTDNLQVTDDNSMIEHLGYRVKMVECGAENIKITTPEDLAIARAIAAYRSVKQ